MLQSIRNNAQGFLAWVIVILIAIPFAFWGIHEYLSPVSKSVIAEVNGTELLEKEFDYNVQQQKRQLRSMLQKDLDLSFMEEQIRQNTIQQMISEEVLVQTALDAGLRISNQVLAQHIREFPAFREDNVFSQGAYENFLRHQGMTPGDFEMQIRRALLTDQLREGVLRSTLLTQHDLETLSRLEQQKRAVSYLTVPVERFKEQGQVAESEIKAYYEQNKQQLYMTPERVSIEYVELTKDQVSSDQPFKESVLKQRYQEHLDAFTTPAKYHVAHILVNVPKESTAEEQKKGEAKAQALYSELKAGAVFEELAKTSSDDGQTKDKGGSLGWLEVGKGQQNKVIEDTIVTLKVGAISSPVKSEFGFHILKLLESTPEKKRSFEEVRPQLEEESRKEQAEVAFYSQSESFANLAFEHPNSLKMLADTLHLTIQSTELFDRQASGPENTILSYPKVVQAAFSDPVLRDNFNSEVIEVGDQHMVVLRIKEHEKSVPKSLEEVKAQITQTLLKDQAKVAAAAKGQQVLEQIKGHKDPQALASAEQLSWSTVSWVDRKDTTLKQPLLVKEAFKMGYPAEGKAIYQGLSLPTGDYAIVAVLGVEEGKVSESTGATHDPNQQTIMRQQQALGETEFQQLVSELESQAKIKNYYVAKDRL